MREACLLAPSFRRGASSRNLAFTFFSHVYIILFIGLIFTEIVPKEKYTLCSCRSQNATDKSVRSTKAKSFFNTEEVETLWNHYPTHCLHRRCKGMRFNIKMAQVQTFLLIMFREIKASVFLLQSCVRHTFLPATIARRSISAPRNDGALWKIFS